MRLSTLHLLWATLRVATLIWAGPLAAGATLEFHVAPDGKDTNPGTHALPLATLEAARDALRQARARPGELRGGATVWIHAGTYLRERSFDLTAADSGHPGAPVVYQAAGDGTVRLLGGRILRDFHPVASEDVLSRLAPAARAQVRQTDLHAQGITNFGQLRSRGFGRPAAAAHLELFVNGRPLTLARWPNEGEWERIAGFPDSTSTGDDHGGKIGALAGGFQFEGDRPARWRPSRDLWIHGYWAWDWANSYERVESLDVATRQIRTAPPHGLYGFRKGQRFYFLNVMEELDQPGEWFVDRGSGMLYLWPPDPDQPFEAAVSLLEEPLISMSDVQHVTLRELTFEVARGHGITIRDGSDVVVADCTLRLLGNYGVRVDGGRRHRIVGCDIQNTGDGGVQLNGGDRRTLTPGEHVVENCRFEKQGRWSKCYVPAVLMNGVGHQVRHNLIQDHPHCAILFGGNEHLIEFNEIHHVALETGDVGAIYAGRDWTFRGNRIRHNYIHHTGGVGMGSMGVYMDDCVSGTEIIGNVFYKVTRAAFLGGGRDHRVENNLFIDCEPAVQIDGRGLDKSPVWHNMVYRYMKQQWEAVPASLYQSRYPALVEIERQYRSGTNGIPPEGNTVARNVSLGGTWLQVGWHARQSMMDVRDNYVSKEVSGVAPDQRQFQLPPDSPAWKTGFQAIPLTKIGPQRR